MNEPKEVGNSYRSPQQSTGGGWNFLQTVVRVATIPLGLMLALSGYRLWQARQYPLSEMTIQRGWIACGVFAALLAMAIILGCWRGPEKPVR